MKVVFAAWIAGAALSLGGCMFLKDPDRLPGIPLEQGAADPHLQQLSIRALRMHDKQAQLELAILYEEGRGVPMKWDLAERLYARAGSASRVRSTPASGGTIPPPSSAGLPEARERLKALKAKRKALSR